MHAESTEIQMNFWGFGQRQKTVSCGRVELSDANTSTFLLTVCLTVKGSEFKKQQTSKVSVWLECPGWSRADTHSYSYHS